MELENLEIRLEKLAKSYRKYFCGHCQLLSEKNYCKSCESDDLLNSLEGAGADIGTSWIEDELLSKVEEANVELLFEEHLETLYGENLDVGLGVYPLIESLKSIDPYSYDLKKYEYQRALINNGTLFERGNRLYLVSYLLRFLNESACPTKKVQ